MTDPAVWWGNGTYERLAERLAPVHDELVAALDPQPGERWLDAATGTGAIASRAARAGADVTGFDFAPAMVEKARAALGDDVRLDLADAQELPYADAGFDVVASCFGVVFAPDRERVAAELARVCRPGGRVGLTSWIPGGELAQAWEPFVGAEPQPSDAWGDPAEVERLLGTAFDLEIERRTWWLEARDGEDAWRLFEESAPPARALLAQVGPELGARLREAFVEVNERHRNGDGTRVPSDYLLVVGTRR